MISPTKPLPFTANPIYLMCNDVWLFVRLTFTWRPTTGLLSIILPLTPTRSGALDEIAVTWSNAWAILLHTLLVVAQALFLLSLVPLAFGLTLPSLYLLYVVAFVVGNQWFTVLLNGPRRRGLFQSNPKCVQGQPAHPHERWVFINGVAVGNHWLQANLDRLALTFRRPIYGIHNQTRGIIFDVLECIIQRDLSFATLDIRQAYAALLAILADDNVHKVVLIVHSQGAIEGGMVLDWLYATVSAAQLRKLEVYTFGNAANHWSSPMTAALRRNRADRDLVDVAGENGTAGYVDHGRVIRHIEHYANTGDWVSRFGILHFRPDKSHSPAATGRPGPRLDRRPQNGSSAHGVQSTVASVGLNPDAEDDNRFCGRLFKRVGSGHQFNQHYLDNIFEMEGLNLRDLSQGKVKDGNAYMDAEVDLAVLNEWDTVQAAKPASRARHARQIKDFSRLWAYRNGGDPDKIVTRT